MSALPLFETPEKNYYSKIFWKIPTSKISASVGAGGAEEKMTSDVGTQLCLYR